MRKAILSLFITLLFCSCGNDTISDNMCGFFEKATDKVEQATTLQELENINQQLMQNIMVYTISLDEEKYKKWDEDNEAQLQIDKARESYAAAKRAKAEELKGK